MCRAVCGPGVLGTEAALVSWVMLRVTRLDQSPPADWNSVGATRGCRGVPACGMPARAPLFHIYLALLWASPWAPLPYIFLALLRASPPLARGRLPLASPSFFIPRIVTGSAPLPSLHVYPASPWAPPPSLPAYGMRACVAFPALSYFQPRYGPDLPTSRSHAGLGK